MGDTITIRSRFDGFEVPAYHAPPGNARRGGVLVIQEIFGVNEHIRHVADGFAADGYEVLAPALFERGKGGFEAGYDANGFGRGKALAAGTPWDQVEGDLRAAVAALAGPVFVVGYCWGATGAWIAACRIQGVSAVSCYYGRQIADLRDETPLCPVIMHFGKHDEMIPPENYLAVGEAHPDIPLHLYDAGHGFNCDARDSYNADAAHLARLRTLQLFHRASGVRGEV